LPRAGGQPRAKKRDQWGKVRATTTSCLGNRSIRKRQKRGEGTKSTARFHFAPLTEAVDETRMIRIPHQISCAGNIFCGWSYARRLVTTVYSCAGYQAQGQVGQVLAG